MSFVVDKVMILQLILQLNSRSLSYVCSSQQIQCIRTCAHVMLWSRAVSCCWHVRTYIQMCSIAPTYVPQEVKC